MPSKILLVNPLHDISTASPMTVQPMGLSYVAAVLLQDHDVKILDANLLKMNSSRVIDHVNDENPDYVGVYSAMFNFNESHNIAKGLDCKTIAGGPATVQHWSEMLEYFDYVVIGEGEVTLTELISRLERGQSPDIPGVAYKKNEAPTWAGARELIKDLDVIPYPAHHLLPDLKKYRMRQRRTPACAMITSRGCPYRCKFCFHGIFGYKYRMRSAENVVGEFKHLMDKYGVQQIRIEDDNATLSRERTTKIFQMVIDEKLDLMFDFGNGIRVDTLDYELLSLMRKGGTYMLGVAPETGDPEILKKIGKKFSLERVKQVVGWCKDLGIRTQAFFMVGFPWEDENTVKNTVDFAVELDPDFVQFSILNPFKGTEVYDYANERGLILEDLPTGDYFTGQFRARTEHLTTEQLSELYTGAYRRFYLRPGKLVRTCAKLFPRSRPELEYFADRFKTILKIAT